MSECAAEIFYMPTCPQCASEVQDKTNQDGEWQGNPDNDEYYEEWYEYQCQDCGCEWNQTVDVRLTFHDPVIQKSGDSNE